MSSWSKLDEKVAIPERVLVCSIDLNSLINLLVTSNVLSFWLVGITNLGGDNNGSSVSINLRKPINKSLREALEKSCDSTAIPYCLMSSTILVPKVETSQITLTGL